MKSAFEIICRYLLPSIKRSLAVELYSRKIPKKEVAKLLDLSPSSVTRYVKGERGHLIDISKFTDVMEYITRLADSIAKTQPDKYLIYEEISKITLYMMSRKYLCGYHRDVDPEVDVAKCNICTKLFKVSTT